MLIKADSARSIRLHTREEKAPVYAYYYDYPIDGMPHCQYAIKMIGLKVTRAQM